MILVSSVHHEPVGAAFAQLRGTFGRVAALAAIITISPGHDASYPWRQVGTSAEPGHGGQGQVAVDYYLSSAEKGGEPPGRWVGDGLAELGYGAGQVVDRTVFERLYGQFADPRDPAGERRLGR